MNLASLVFSVLLISSSPLLAFTLPNLVSPESIQKQKEATSEIILPGNLPLIYRRIPDSDIVQISVNFQMGLSHVSEREKPLLEMLLSLIPRGSASYPKEKVFATLEKLSAGISCQTGIESSSCHLMGLAEFLPELLPMFIDLMQNASLDPKEAKLIYQQEEAGLLNATQNPENYVNEVVNKVFYSKPHPYWSSNETLLKGLRAFKQEQLAPLYQRWKQSSYKTIFALAAEDPKIMSERLSKVFQGIKQGKKPAPAPTLASKVTKPRFAFAARDIQTAYLRAKFVMPGIQSKDAAGVSLLMKILSEDLEEEVRTKRSLSYSVYAQNLSLEQGIGVLHASTSQPEATLKVIAEVVDRFRQKPIAEEDLRRHKTVFTTHYFLTLEEHSSLASALASSYQQFGQTDRFYDWPKEIEAVKVSDLQRIARTYFRNMSLGIVYRKELFQQKWAEDFLKVINTQQ